MIRVLGVDMAFANMGMVLVTVKEDLSIEVDDMCLVRTTAQTGKAVRVSSDELRRAQDLRRGLLNFYSNTPQRPTHAIAEVPSGSQSASAARCLGIAVGVLASCPIPIIEVSPMEVKAAVTGTRNRKVKATKKDVIAWAVDKWPSAPWIRVGGKPGARLTLDNEHLADALATVVAGLATPEFQRLLPLLQSYAAPRPSVLRSTPRRLIRD
jgi:Holliday junction resolvasome RuvABC endonuclease subunit